MKEGKASANIKGITLDKEDNTGDLGPLEKLMTLETVCFLVNQNAKAKQHVNVGIDAEEYYKIKNS